MPSIVIEDDDRIIKFRGRGLVSSEPDATNIVIVDNTQSLEQTGQPIQLEIPDNRLTVEIKETDYAVRTIGIQGVRGIPVEDVLLDDDKLIDFIDDDHWYEGWAVAGTEEAATGWKIKYTSIINAEGDTTKKWADGAATYNKTWDDRLTYTY